MQVNLSELVANAVLFTPADAIVTIDREGTIRFWNRGAERIFGYSGEEAIGSSLDIIIPERLRKRHWDGFARVMQTGRSRYGEGDLLSVPALRKDGATLSVQFAITPMQHSGKMVGMAAVLRDMTREFHKMRELERELSQLRASIDRNS